tara:strand:+ start:798 stop:1043 length:246 start_codon:yes stop_codon:yes gene_type:complete
MKVKKILNWLNEYENKKYEDSIVDESGFEIYEVDLEDDKEKFVFKVDWDRRGDSDIELISGNVDNVDVDEEDMKMFVMENR